MNWNGVRGKARVPRKMLTFLQDVVLQNAPCNIFVSSKDVDADMITSISRMHMKTKQRNELNRSKTSKLIGYRRPFECLP